MGVVARTAFIGALVFLGLTAADSGLAWSPTCTITGTGKGDVLRGTSHADVICGRAGEDVIRGGGGRDLLYGGAGRDILRGGSRADALYGGAGGDKIDGGKGPDLLFSLGAAADDLDGGDAFDRALVEPIDDTVSIEERFPSEPTGDPTLLAAGDIANCRDGRRGPWLTAPLLDLIPAATVAAVGDTAYPNGSLAVYGSCYEPTWGRAKERTRPAVGNHEYRSDAVGYFSYFGATAGDPSRGYYSYDLGSWHIIVLNTNSILGADALDCARVSCAAGSAQELWLQQDLAASRATCTLAYWHHPRFDSGGDNYTVLDAFWRDLDAAAVDVVINGHEHRYERFAPQVPDGSADAHGIAEFIVGTGGAPLESAPPGALLANSLAEQSFALGVLRLSLHATSYDWQFLPADAEAFSDSGTASCH